MRPYVALALLGLAACSGPTKQQSELAKSCLHAPDVTAAQPSSRKWADAIAACLERHGQHATIVQHVDIPTKKETYVVKWGEEQIL